MQLLRERGLSWGQVGAVFMERYRLSAMAAMREAHGWSQEQAAEQWSLRWPKETRSAKDLSWWETWRHRSGLRGGPSLRTLERLAQLYQCQVTDLLVDVGSRGQDGTDEPDDRAEDRVVQVDELAVRDAFARAEALEAEVLSRWPRAWKAMDQLRERPIGDWPHWCLLPDSAAQMVVSGPGMSGRPGPAAAVSALYAWRFTRSVYAYQPGFAARVMQARPDQLDRVAPFVTLPEWCVYIAAGQAGFPGAGLWAHVAYDPGVGRPKLSLLVDVNDGGLDSLVALPVYLDHDTLSQAVAELRDAVTPVEPVGAVDRLVALVAYLAQRRADIVAANGSGQWPIRWKYPIESQRVWAVGFTPAGRRDVWYPR